MQKFKKKLPWKVLNDFCVQIKIIKYMYNFKDIYYTYKAKFLMNRTKIKHHKSGQRCRLKEDKHNIYI